MGDVLFTDIDYQTVAGLKADGEWPIDWLPIKGLLPYIRRLGPNITGIEIGVARAESSYRMLETCPNIATLYGVDAYKAYDDWNGHVNQEHNDKTKKIALDNMAEFGDRFKLLSMSSQAAAQGVDCQSWDEESIDFIFVDGDHSYEGVTKDFEDYYPFLKKGGIWAGHDHNLGTVRRVIEEFRNKNRIRVPINLSDNNTFFWSKT